MGPMAEPAFKYQICFLLLKKKMVFPIDFHLKWRQPNRHLRPFTGDKQGDRIGRIFAYCAIVYFGQFFIMTKAHWDTLFTVKVPN
jgi:hypothetical protein